MGGKELAARDRVRAPGRAGWATGVPHAARRAADRLIVALDAITLADVLAMAKRLQGLVRTVKVGSALFTAHGPSTVARLRAMGFGVMLDLKFFDIPSTVELSCRAAAGLRVSLLTVHACGEPEMLEAAVRGARDGAKRLGTKPPAVLGVTVLTSVGRRLPVRIQADVVRLAQRAYEAGCDGVVASAQEAAALRRRFGRRLQIVCPGIRPARAAIGDQERSTTPREALVQGADRLVVGRPITAAANPRTAAQQMLTEMEAVNGC